jgi:non-heme chloroperoxidase
MRSILRMAAWALICFAGTTCAAQNSAIAGSQPAAWHDPSPHTVQFIAVDKDVKLEVLDWGGSGRPLVFLAGLGDTAHVFDDLAPELTPEYHVYGITRRGYGASSAPAVGGPAYSANRLGDDVLAVLDALKIERPVLVGHSIAGEELSSVATRHPERVAGLVYLDAAYFYAFYSRAAGVENTTLDLTTLQRALAKLQTFPPDYRPLVDEMLNEDLPAVESDLREMQKQPANGPPPRPQPQPPTAADYESYQTWQAMEKRNLGFEMPEGELRQIHATTPEGHVGALTPRADVAPAVVAGEQKYTDIRVPVLAIFAVPHDPGLFYHRDPAALTAWESRDKEQTGALVDAFEKGVPSAHVVRLPYADHYIFFTNEADVLREMRAFIGGLS